MLSAVMKPSVQLTLTLLSILVVGFLTATHDPRFNFDESYTLQISSLSWSGIDDVLANDPNFALYYKTLHVLFLLFGSSYKAAVFFNYIAWLASLFVFGKVAGTLREAASGEKNVYFVTSPGREYLLPEEIGLINVFPFKKLVAPGVFWFRKAEE